MTQLYEDRPRDHYDLTDKEMVAAVVLMQSAMNQCGAKRPEDFEHSEETWLEPSALTGAGYSEEEAAAYWSSLVEKVFIRDMAPHGYSLSTHAWQWMANFWDEVKDLKPTT